jgi:enoyl-CoA hydratase/carnithine racemase
MIEVVMSSPAKNSLGTKHMERLIAELEAAREQPVLLSGAGDTFSAGLDLKEVASLDVAGMERYLRLFDRLTKTLYHHAAPTVAHINGHAIAGGCVLAMCCDIRIASANPKIRIGMSEVAVGVTIPPLIMALCKHRVPKHTLEKVLLEAGVHEPRRALELGLIDEVSDDSAAAARAQLARLAALPRDVYVTTKRELRAGVLDISAEDERRYREELIPQWAAPEVKARVAVVSSAKK